MISDKTKIIEYDYYDKFDIDYDFKEIVILQDKGERLNASYPYIEIALCVPVNVSYGDTYNGNVLLYVDGEEQFYERIMTTIMAFKPRINHQHLESLSLEEMIGDFNKFAIILDLLLYHYNDKKFKIQKYLNYKNMRIIQNFSPELLKNIPIDDLSGDSFYPYHYLAKITYRRKFINYAYDYYTNNYEDIMSGKNNDFFSRLLISFCSLNFAGGKFSAEYMINPDTYENSNTQEIVINAIENYNEEDKIKIGENIYSNFVTNLYLQSVLSKKNFSEIMNTDSDLISRIIKFDNKYFKDNFYIDSKVKNPEQYNQYYYGAEPENINDLVSSTLKRNIKIKPEIKKNTMITPDFNLRCDNSSLSSTWLSIGRVETNSEFLSHKGKLLKNTSDMVVDFLYSPKILDYLEDYGDDDNSMKVEQICREMGIDLSNNKYLKVDGTTYKSLLMVPFLIYTANKHFSLNISPKSFNDYLNYWGDLIKHVKNNKDDDELKTLISENIVLLSVLIPRLDNKEKVELFMQLYAHYYSGTPLNDSFSIKTLNDLVDNITLAHNVINGSITLDHAINILDPQ